MKTYTLLVILTLWIAICQSCAIPPEENEESESPTDDTSCQLPWSGETDKFTFNAQEGVRLNDPSAEAGTAYITIPSTNLRNTRWEFGVRLTFNPSANNFARIYLTASSGILSGSFKGYFIQIGGAKDNVALYCQEGTQPQLLAAGRELMKGNNAPKIYVKVECDKNGYWRFWTRMESEADYTLEKQVKDTRITTSAYCGIYCEYTKSRCDGFTFHHIQISNEVESAVPDATPEEPNEPEEPETPEAPEEPTLPESVKGMLLLNEIMYDHAADGAEYIELYNPSNEPVSISTIRFIRYVDDGNGSTVTTQKVILQHPNSDQSLIIAPHGYICFTKSADALTQKHKVDGKTIIEIAKFPSISNEGGYLAITTDEARPRTIDKCCYFDSMHTDKKRKQGVSLAKKSPELSSLNANWHSSTNSTGGTPGVRN